MAANILVAYATKHGATADIATKIGSVLQQSRLNVDVRAVEDVDDIEIYRAVVLGSAVYMGQWRKEALHFLEAYTDALAARQVWLFSSGPTGAGDPEMLLNGWRLPDAVEPFVRRIQPRAIALFHGTLEPHRLSVAERLVIRALRAPVGDFRDWDAIESWAAEIAAALQ